MRIIDKNAGSGFSKRRFFVLGIYIILMVGLFTRAVYLQIFNKEFLKDHGDARALRVVEIPANRGAITDRNGEPLAISTPVSSIWAEPQQVMANGIPDLELLAEYLQMQGGTLITLLQDQMDRQFVYLKRHTTPKLAEQVMSLNIPGIFLQKEHRRYYPASEVTAHVLGFTNIDDVGQEGVELAYNSWLQGVPGSKKVLKDRLGHIIDDVEKISAPTPGKQLALSIDKRVQYLAYRELKDAVSRHKANAGVLVMLHAKTGEVIAMVGQPSYNPNKRTGMNSAHYRNRALTDVFEPGSTLKPFTVATALQVGLYNSQTTIDTNPGTLRVGKYIIRETDDKNYGVINLSKIIKKSSNIGISKVALSLQPSDLWSSLVKVGFGQVTASGFPGEATGYLTPYNDWSDVQQATMSFGYGISVTALQLAQSYLVFSGDGKILPVSFLKIEKPTASRRVFDSRVARQLRDMLETVADEGGTGQRGAIPGYRVAGKTGTVRKVTAGGYTEDRYLSLFVGLAPASDPHLVTVVMLDEPKNGQYYGGLVAAPVFANVMAGALRILNVPPDDLSLMQEKIAATEGAKK